MSISINIAIDGPVSSGKSTISKKLAKEVNKCFISTGLIYRAIAYKSIQLNIDLNNHKEIGLLIDKLSIDFDENSNIVVDGQVLTNEIRKEEISTAASLVAVIPLVRKKLVKLQKDIAKKGGTIMEGRDIGTVILPNAELKIYLTCDPTIRAKRRYEDNKSRGIKSSLEEIIDNIKKRDYLDMTRELAPLKKADDAIEIDSSNLTINEVVEEIKKHIKK